METSLNKTSPKFISINKKLFAEYYLIYRVKNNASINDLSKITSKHQLQFEKVENKKQELNLIYVDRKFVNILSDLTLSVFLKNASTFNEYIMSNDKIKIIEETNDYDFFRYKFFHFIHLLLYSNLSSTEIFNQNLFTDRVFCLKNQFNEIEFFSIYEQKELQLKLFDEMKIKIDYSLSSISNQSVRLCLKIYSKFDI